MRSRWLHTPLLHTPHQGLEKRPTWLELFYDLIFVAAFIQLGNGLSDNVTPAGCAVFAGTFVPLWVAWSGFTFYVNRFTVDDFAHRSIVFVQMFAVGGMAISAPGVFAGRTFAFSTAAAIAMGMVAVMYGRSYGHAGDGRPYARYWGILFAAASACFAAGALLPPPFAYAGWALATLLVLGGPLSPASRAFTARFPLDFEHLSERYGLLTIIVLGESFVKVLTALVTEGAGLPVYLEGAVLLLLTCGVWWVYFDDVAGAHIRSGQGQWVIWLYAHIPLQLAVTASGVAIKKAVHFGWDEPAPTGYRLLLAGSLSLIYLSVAAIDSVTERKQAELSDRARVNARAASGILLLALAPAGKAMSGGLFLLLVAAVNVAQVVFDMMMAPLAQSAADEQGKKTIADLARESVEAGRRPGRRLRRDLSEAVRKGTPSELRQDLYFYFIDGSWWRLASAFSFLFLIINVFFAALYTLEPGAIQNARPDSFADAFFFSVQTMSTIGYGALSPGDAWGNAMVTIEAAVGMVGVAVVTGVVFAKLSRPRAGVLFSKNLVLTTMHGKRVLMLRAGNTRGNDVVEASVSLAVMIDELSPEGHHLRRVHDLRLVRSRTPMFVLTWSVMHEIDADSPLADVDWDAPEEHISLFVATLMGHDGTYGQTVYARKAYDCDDLLVGRRFVDIMSELPDGRMMIDYEHFHDTRRDEPPTPAS